jgi:hypothetical protein
MMTRHAKPRVHSAHGRYYTLKERARRMLAMKNVHQQTLQEIGDEFLVTRERVRQILNTTGKKWQRNPGGKGALRVTRPFMFSRVFWEANRLKSNAEIAIEVACSPDRVRRVRHLFFPWAFRSRGRCHSNALQATRDRLVRLAGFKSLEISFPKSSMILAGGVTIRVRNRTKNRGFWSLSHVSRADFIIAVCEELDGSDFHFFVIPWSAAKRSTGGISITWPPKTDRPNKWEPYLEAWNLVRAERLRKMRRQGGTASPHQQVEDTEGQRRGQTSRGEQFAPVLGLSSSQCEQDG